jgi:hypothetical protein
MLLPADLVIRATENLAHSALPGAAVRPVAARKPTTRRCLSALSSIAQRLRPTRNMPPEPPQGDARYAAWKAAAALSAEALAAWLSADAGRPSETHAVYRAALDREQAAARELAKASVPRWSSDAVMPVPGR